MDGGGQSFLGGVAQMGAGYVVGHVASRAIENVIFGGHNAAPGRSKPRSRCSGDLARHPTADSYSA
jgi:hypothetical protein